MAYVGYQQISVSSDVLNASILSIPSGATHAEIQAETQNVRYTMDNKTTPTVAIGMIFLTTEPPKSFAMVDVKDIHFIRDGGSDAVLNIHYFGGRKNL